MKKKPDALVLLAVVFGLGVLVSSLTYGGSNPRLDEVAATMGMAATSGDRDNLR
ncbi:hypothetical protein [Isoalcanivorax beigongshangi]|uniref:Uncharacterized protein n=1 Tax=Isoalcanivorax beigongshangi TaxID=3238810 RepID=A0ABV4AJ74_9GAMM